MDRSILRSPDSSPLPPQGERRRSVRQKLHSPVYVSFNAAQAGLVIDLSELLDLNEEGFAVQTSERLEVNRAVTLCLDLPETKSYIHGSGQVIWSDDSGRTGIRFSFLPDRSRKVLKEWLFSNLLVASSNHAARTEQLVRHRQQAPADEAIADNVSSPVSPPSFANQSVTATSDRATLLSTLDEVRGQVREMEEHGLKGAAARANRDAVLHFITDRALHLTGAAGAALAFLTDGQMACRASVGEPAPPVGSAVDVSEGLSGECIRSGLLVTCKDSETDARVDPEVCRALNIGSLMAAPILADFRVVGVLEVFSPYPGTFTTEQGTILERLAELVPKSEKKPEPLNAPRIFTETSRDRLLRAQPRPAGDASARATETGLPAFASANILVEQTAIASAPSQASSDIQSHRSASAKLEAPLARPAQPDAEAEIASVLPAEPPLPNSHYFHLALLATALAVVAMVVGYLLAPVIEKRWAVATPVSQISENTSQPSSALAPVSLASVGASKTRPVSPQALRLQAEQGDAEAQWKLGVLYHSGDSFPQDDAQAVQWYLRSAQQGYVPAQAALGSFYWAGRGVPQSYTEAYFWSQLALAQGDDHSKSLLEGLATQMTQSQVADARQRAEAWLRKHNQEAKLRSN